VITRIIENYIGDTLVQIAFINPPQPQLREPLAYPHLGIAYLSTMVRRNARLDNLAGGWNGTLEHADIFAITLPTACRNSVAKIIPYIRKTHPESIVVLGGVHPTVCPTDAATLHPDYVVRGEAEYFMLELDELKRQYTKTITIDVGYIDNINTLPIPDRSIFDRNVVINTTGIHGSTKPSTTMSTARGCPYNCAYCCKGHEMYRRLRLRSPNNIELELKYLRRQYGIEHIRFVDDTFTIHKKRTLDICKKLKHHKTSFICMTRADKINREVAMALSDSECIQVQIGLESGSDRMLSLMNKKETVEDHRRAVKLLHEVGVPVKTLLMMNFPGETETDRQETLAFLRETKPESFNLAKFTPLPGSAIPWNGETAFFYPDEDEDWVKYRNQVQEAIS